MQVSRGQGGICCKPRGLWGVGYMQVSRGQGGMVQGTGPLGPWVLGGYAILVNEGGSGCQKKEQDRRVRKSCLAGGYGRGICQRMRWTWHCQQFRPGRCGLHRPLISEQVLVCRIHKLFFHHFIELERYNSGGLLIVLHM